MDERTNDTIAKSDELRRLLVSGDANELVQAARRAMVAIEFRIADRQLGLPSVARNLVQELYDLMIQAVERSSELGSGEAALWLGDIRYDNDDFDSARALFAREARAGNPAGAAKYAELLRREEAEEHYAEAVGWLDKALPYDTNGAVHYVRGLYAFNGYGCRADKVASFGFHERSAELGCADAMFELYAMFAQGVGCKADPARAVEWCVKAAEGGNIRAMSNLGGMYATGNGLPKDLDESVKWYERAAENGHPRAAVSLACMYAMGQEIEQDIDKAKRYFAQAEELGCDWRPLAEQLGLDPAEWEND